MKNLLYLSVLLVFFSQCKSNAQTPDPIPAHDSLKIESKEVNETRVINIWLPEDYTTSGLTYPVLYMPDGGIKEDFPHIANTLSELISSKKIPPHILVGIENTERRRDLTPPTQVEKDKEIAPVVGGSAEFRAFIQNELIPEINNRYRTTSKKGIIGESLAGLFIVETFLTQPELFDFYIAFDPSLWWNDKYVEKNAPNFLTQFPTEQKKLWFAGSDAKDIYKSTRKLADILKENAPENLTWTYSDEPKEKHSTIFRATKEKAMIWTMNEYQPN